MTKIFNYSVGSDFDGNFNPGQFFHEIESSNIEKRCFHSKQDGDSVEIVFETDLSGSEETILNSLVSSHIIRYNFETPPFTFQPVVVKSTTWKQVLSFYINGTNNSQIIQEVKLYSKQQNGGSNYKVRLYDVTNSKTIFEETYTNTSFTSHNITSFSNHPDEEAILELHMKSGSRNKKCYLNACKISFN